MCLSQGAIRDDVCDKEMVSWKGTTVGNDCPLEDLVSCCTVWLRFSPFCRDTAENIFSKDFITNFNCGWDVFAADLF